MKRRSFLASLGALISAPALPLPLSAAPTVPSAAAAQFATAKLLARAHNRCSPAMLQRLMQVDPAVAAELNGMLVRRGVISAAAADGASMALDPLNTHCVPKEALRPTNLRQLIERAKARLDQFAELPEKEAAKATDAEEHQP